jgi:hypothetical protein
MRLHRALFHALLFAVFALLAPSAADAQTIYTVNIDATANGSYVAGGPQNLLPGTTAQPYNPVQLTLGAGIYQITNAASSGYYSAWNFQGSGLSSTSNWVWSFEMAVDGGAIIEDAYVNFNTSSKALAAGITGTPTYNGNTLLGATSTAGFYDTFTLSTTTLLDFYVDDYNGGLGDNYGGVSLNIQAVPEPSTYAALSGLAALGFAAYRRQQKKLADWFWVANPPALAVPPAARAGESSGIVEVS